MDKHELEEIELDVFLGLVQRCYGYYFHDYTQPSVKKIDDKESISFSSVSKNFEIFCMKAGIYRRRS